MVVRVAIDLALDRLFDYEVPAALERKLAVGQLLSVPFGRREARGFAIEVAAAGVAVGGAPRQLKPVAGIIDETPFFSPSLFLFCDHLVDEIHHYIKSENDEYSVNYVSSKDEGDDQRQG